MRNASIGQCGAPYGYGQYPVGSGQATPAAVPGGFYAGLSDARAEFNLYGAPCSVCGAEPYPYPVPPFPFPEIVQPIATPAAAVPQSQSQNASVGAVYGRLPGVFSPPLLRAYSPPLQTLPARPLAPFAPKAIGCPPPRTVDAEAASLPDPWRSMILNALSSSYATPESLNNLAAHLQACGLSVAAGQVRRKANALRMSATSPRPMMLGY